MLCLRLLLSLGRSFCRGLFFLFFLFIQASAHPLKDLSLMRRQAGKDIAARNLLFLHANAAHVSGLRQLQKKLS